LNKIIDVTNDDLDGDEVSDNGGDASNDVIEPVMLSTSHAPVAGHAHGSKTPEKSNSFRRKNVSRDVTEPVTIPTSHTPAKGHAPVSGHTPTAETPEKSNSFRRRKNVSCSTQNAVQVVKFGFSEKAKKNLKKNLTLVLKLLCKSFVKTILLD
jgi:hypothetical protein